MTLTVGLRHDTAKKEGGGGKKTCRLRRKGLVKNLILKPNGGGARGGPPRSKLQPRILLQEGGKRSNRGRKGLVSHEESILFSRRWGDQ